MLLAQFNRFLSVGLVLTAVVMSTIGVLLGLLIMGQPFGVVMTGIGIIALFLIGPDRLPGYAAQLARLVRSLRSISSRLSRL